jgi:micrococcal nuclease
MKKCYKIIMLFGLLAAMEKIAVADELYRVNQENLKSSYDADVSKMLRVYVRQVVPGNILLVDIENPPPGLDRRERVQIIGLETPEAKASRQMARNGRAVNMLTKEALEEKYVYLAFDGELRDRYGQLLAYVYFENGGCFNAMMMRQGYAHVYSRYSFQFLEEFKLYGQEA